MKKSVYALFLLLVCVFALGGCSAKAQSVNFAEQNAFRIIRNSEASGKIDLIYIFPVNTKILQEKGFSESEISAYKFYLANYVSALSRQYEEKIVDGVCVSGCTYFSDVDGLGFVIKFDDLDVQRTFFDVPENEQSTSDVKTSGFFMKKVEIAVDFPVSSENSLKNFKAICEMAMSSWCKDNGHDLQDVLSILDESVFIYDFATTETGLKSNTMLRNGNVTHNIFVKEQDEIKQGSKIVFYSTSPNVPVWYVSALVVVLLGMVIAYIILRKKAKRKKTN